MKVIPLAQFTQRSQSLAISRARGVEWNAASPAGADKSTRHALNFRNNAHRAEGYFTLSPCVVFFL